MMVIARETLAKSEGEIAVANVAMLLVSASRMVSGEVIPNFEAIVEQSEMSFAQKHKDTATVQALLNGDHAVVPMLQHAAETIRHMCNFSEVMTLDSIAPIQMPTKPLHDSSRMRDTLRRLHYVQKVVEAAAKWLNDIGEHDTLKESVRFTKSQHELIRTFKRIVVQVQQAAIIIGKYRDMGDICVLREMTLDVQVVLNELKQADESVSEKRKSIPFFKRAVEESKAAPKPVRQLASVASGLAVVVVLSIAIMKLNALAPQVFSTLDLRFESESHVEQKNQLPLQNARAQENETQPSTKFETAAPKQTTSPVSQTPIHNVAPQREAVATSTTKPTPAVTSLKSNPQPKSAAKEPNWKKPEARKPETETSVAQVKSALPAPPSEDKAKSISASVKKLTSKPSENETESTGKEVSQHESERALPKRKTIVIED